MSGNQVTVFGGTGYLGRHVVHHLVRAGYRVRVSVRDPQPSLFRDTGGAVEQTQVDVREETSVAAAIKGVDGVVNAVGLYVERGAATFEAVHAEGALHVARQSAGAGAQLVHISGIGADLESESRYVRTRAAGEQNLRDAAPDAVILRPSVLFGPGDVFLHSLANLICYLPIVPLFGSGTTRVQPVYVEDVAEAIVRALANTESSGRVYELGGPRIYTYRELFEALGRYLRRRRWLLPVPFFVWDIQAAVASLLPNPPLTRDQIALIRRDNVVGSNTGTFRDLGIKPHALEDVLPACLDPC